MILVAGYVNIAYFYGVFNNVVGLFRLVYFYVLHFRIVCTQKYLHKIFVHDMVRI